MPERYPDDATLLTLAQDASTGVEYIPTGRTPYYVEFRRMMQRALLAAGRANDLRPYQDGDLTIGVRPGRCFINGVPQDFAGTTGAAAATNATTYFWIDSSGALQTGVGLPADRTAFIPLAEVVAGSSAISSITDLRGEVFLGVPNLASLGLSATAAQVNAALAGINAGVTAAALNTLTGGSHSTADSLHRHLQVDQNTDGEVYFILYNHSSGASANAALVLSSPNRFSDDLVLLPNVANGFLTQRYNGQAYNLVGSVHAQFRQEGSVTASLSGKLIGAVPITGVVTDVVLSVGSNIDSTATTDGLTAVAKVNGVALAAAAPKITKAAGAGFRSTARGDGTAAVIKSDGTQNVQRGDLLTLDLTRTATGTVATEAADVVVMVVIRASQPE